MSGGTNTQLITLLAKLAMQHGPDIVKGIRDLIGGSGGPPAVAEFDDALDILRRNPETYFTDHEAEPSGPPITDDPDSIYEKRLDSIPWDKMQIGDMPFRTRAGFEPVQFWIVKKGSTPMLPSTFERTPINNDGPDNDD